MRRILVKGLLGISDFYWLLSIAIDYFRFSQSIKKIFLWVRLLSITDNYRLIDFRYGFLSIDYAWNSASYDTVLRQWASDLQAKKRRNRWIDKIFVRRKPGKPTGWDPSKNSVICSKHWFCSKLRLDNWQTSPISSLFSCETVSGLPLTRLFMRKQVVSPNVLFARSRFARTQSRFAQSLKSFHPECEVVSPGVWSRFARELRISLFLLEISENHKNQVKFKILFSSMDGWKIELQQSLLSNLDRLPLILTER